MRIIFNPILDTRLILAYHENRFVLIEKKLTEFFNTDKSVRYKRVRKYE